jgi:hypothetical protein
VGTYLQAGIYNIHVGPFDLDKKQRRNNTLKKPWLDSSFTGPTEPEAIKSIEAGANKVNGGTTQCPHLRPISRLHHFEPKALPVYLQPFGLALR